MIYCPQCGKEFDDDAVFCTACGVRMMPSAEQPAETEPVQAPSAAQTVSESEATELAAQTVSEPEATELAAKSAAEPETAHEEEAEPETVAAKAPVQAADAAFKPDKPEAAPRALESPLPQAPPKPPYTELPYMQLKKEKVVRPSAAPSEPRTYTFLNTGVGLIYAFMLILIVAVMTRFSNVFFVYENINNVLWQMGVCAVLGIAAVLSVRSRGLDLSLGLVMGLAATIIAQTMNAGGSLTMGVMLALSAGLIIGLINGLAAVYLKIPAVIVTLVTGLVAGSINTVLLQGQTVTVTFPPILQGANAMIALAVVLGGVFLLAFVFILFSKLGKPFFKREKKQPALSLLFAYIVCSLAAVSAGFVMLARIQASAPLLGTGYEAYLVFVFALLMASRGLDNRFAPALYALVPAFIWAVLSNILVLLNVIVYYQPIIFGGLALVSLCVAYLCRMDRRVKMSKVPSFNAQRWQEEPPNIFN